MEDLAATLTGIGQQLGAVVAAALDGIGLDGASDAALLEAVAAAAGIGRLAEAVMVAGAGVVQDRSASAVREERLSTRMGCGTVGELLQRVTRASRRKVAEYERGARAVHQPTSIATGSRGRPTTRGCAVRSSRVRSGSTG